MHDHSDGATVVPTGAATDVLAADVPETKPAPWLLVVGVGVLVLALVGGITYGLRALSRGGAQPEDALPAGAFAFAEIDLDPPAGQKLDAFRFLRRFPALLDKLVENAVDFCLPGQPIDIRLENRTGESLLTVANKGPALPGEMRGRLFQSMISVREQRDAGAPHLGLGLYVARLIAEFHGGNIVAVNLPSGDGVAVTVRMPAPWH